MDRGYGRCLLNASAPDYISPGISAGGVCVSAPQYPSKSLPVSSDGPFPGSGQSLRLERWLPVDRLYEDGGLVTSPPANYSWALVPAVDKLTDPTDALTLEVDMLR